MSATNSNTLDECIFVPMNLIGLIRKSAGTREYNNTLWSLLDLGAYPLLMIIATPLFLNILGASAYGLWILANSIIQILQVLNFGTADSTIRLVSQSGTDIKSAAGSVGRNLTFSFLLVLFCLLTGYMSGLSNLLPNLFHIDVASFHQMRLLLILGAGSIGMKFTELVLLGTFKGYQRFDISARLSMLSRCSMVLINMIVVYSGHGLVMVFVSTLLMNMINLCIQFFILRKTFPELASHLAPGLPGWDSFFNNNFWYWLQSSIALLGFLADKIFVAAFFDMKTLGYYALGSLIAIQIHNILLSLGSFIFPKVSSNTINPSDGRDIFLRASSLLNPFGWTVLLFLLSFGPLLFNIWLGEESWSRAGNYINLFLIFESAILLMIVPFHFVNGTTHLKWNSFFEILMKTSLVLSMFAGNYFFGTDGVIVGMIIAAMVNLPFQYYFLSSKIFQLRLPRVLIWQLFIPLLFVLLLLLNPSTPVGFIVSLLSFLCMAFLFLRNIIRYLNASLS